LRHSAAHRQLVDGHHDLALGEASPHLVALLADIFVSVAAGGDASCKLGEAGLEEQAEFEGVFFPW
jgi:hypothetical protein